MVASCFASTTGSRAASADVASPGAPGVVALPGRACAWLGHQVGGVRDGRTVQELDAVYGLVALLFLQTPQNSRLIAVLPTLKFSLLRAGHFSLEIEAGWLAENPLTEAELAEARRRLQ